MTDQTTTDQTNDPSTEPEQVSTEQEATEQEATEQTETTKPGKEAAKYRTRLREAEADRDTVREQMSALRRQVAEGASGLAKPAALWAAGVDPDDLFSDDGQLDTEALATAVEQATETLGAQRKSGTPKPDPTQGSQATGVVFHDPWAQAFTP